MDLFSNREVISVSDLTRSAKQLLEGNFPMVFVEGEISNFAMPASGHWYFTLKDAKSQLRCAMFKMRNQRLRFVPRNGLQVIVRGKISLYEGRGEFQMIAEFMEEAGDGALRRAFEKLKAQLDAEGLFDSATKLELPTLPGHVGIITSPTGAAVRDAIHVLQRRFPAIHVSVIPVPVQGDDAAPAIVRAIELANNYTSDPFDVLLLTRGGGSLEDLWAFNTEPVARAIHASRLPIVSAVGHETDFTIADFVADVRAPTPSAAAEIISPDISSWQQQLANHQQKLQRSFQHQHQQWSAHLRHLEQRMRSPADRLSDLHQRLDDLEARLKRGLKQKIASLRYEDLALRLKVAMQRRLQTEQQGFWRLQSRLPSPLPRIQQQRQALLQLQQSLKHGVLRDTDRARHQLRNVTGKLDALSPLRILERGYSVVTRGDSTTQVVIDAAALSVGEQVTARLHKGLILAEVKQIKDASPLDTTLADTDASS